MVFAFFKTASFEKESFFCAFGGKLDTHGNFYPTQTKISLVYPFKNRAKFMIIY